MKIVTVIPLKKGAARDDLTYFSAKEIPPGSIVTVPLRSKKILGLVVSSESVIDKKSNIKGMDFNLRKIEEVKENSVFLKEYFDSAIETGKYFVANQNNTITSLIPAIFLQKYDEISKFKNKKDTGAQNKKNVKSEKLILQMPTPERISSYRTFIRGAFAEKKSVFIVLPTEHDIEIFHRALSRGIEQFTFAVHGGLSPKKALSAFEAISTLSHPVLIIGTAPFLSMPRSDLETIILEHESSGSYKMIARPHLDLRVFVELFAAKINAKFILSDTLLSFETIGRSEIDGLNAMHTPSYRVNFEGEIKTSGRDEKKFKVLTDESLEEIKVAVGKKKNVFIFSLRKGLATQTVCKDCNEVVSCEKCLAPLVLHYSESSRGDDTKKRMFVCNRCEDGKDADIKCKSCWGWNLVPLGIGTDTVLEEVKKLFSFGRSPTGESKEKAVKIFKLDKESAKNQKGAEKIAKEFEKSKGAILVGTEMAFFYLKDKVPLSVVASFDSLWSIPNFKMSEKIIQLMLSIIGNTTEKFIIQTRNENDPAIAAIQNYNLLPFVREGLKDRENLNYPPYKRFIKIRYLGDKEQTKKARTALAETFKEYSPEIFSGFMPRTEGKYSTNALLKLDIKNWSLPEISHGASIDEDLFQKLSLLPPNFEVVVDPEDLL